MIISRSLKKYTAFSHVSSKKNPQFSIWQKIVFSKFAQSTITSGSFWKMLQDQKCQHFRAKTFQSWDIGIEEVTFWRVRMVTWESFYSSRHVLQTQSGGCPSHDASLRSYQWNKKWEVWVTLRGCNRGIVVLRRVGLDAF